MADELKQGDVVRLKSGGPNMTIEGIGIYGMAGDHEQAKCSWFDGAKLKTKVFELWSLKKVPS